MLFLLTQQSHHVCLIAVISRHVVLLRGCSTAIIQEDELCFPLEIYAAGRLSDLREPGPDELDWRKANNSRVTLTTTRLRQPSISRPRKRASSRLLCGDALARCVPLCLSWLILDVAHRFH